MIAISCQCGARYRVPEKLAGKRVKCKQCGSPIPIPVPEPAPEAADEYEVDLLADEPATIGGTAVAGPAVISVPAAAARPASDKSSHLGPYLRDCAASLMFFAETGNLLRFVIVAAITMLRPLLWYAPCIGLLALIIVFGWIFSFLFNVLLNAADGQRDLPELTLMEGLMQTVIAPCFKFLAALIVACCPMVVYGVIDPEAVEQGEPTFWVFVGLGVFLWPMAILMVGIGGISSFARPDLIVRTLIRTLMPYLLVCVLTAGALVGSWFIHQTLTGSGGKGSEHPIALLCALEVLELYAWVLVMRFLGLYYHHFKTRFAWTWG